MSKDCSDATPWAQPDVSKPKGNPKPRGASQIVPGLLVVGFAAAWIMMFFDHVVMPLAVLSGLELEMPDLHYMSVPDAQRVCEDLGFEFSYGRSRVDERVPAGTVLDQYPVAGKRVKPGRRVEVVVSSGATLEICPDVRGRSPREAAIIADSAGLIVNLDNLAHEFSDSIPEGVVMQQSPSPLTGMQHRDEVRLVVSLGSAPEEYVAPNLVGRKVSGLKMVLARYDLVLGNVVNYPDRSTAPGTVLQQDPPAGTVVEPGSTIDVRVAAPPRLSK